MESSARFVSMIHDLRMKHYVTILLPRSMRVCLPLFACYFQLQLRPICRFWYNVIVEKNSSITSTELQLNDIISQQGNNFRFCGQKELMLMLLYSQYPLNSSAREDGIDSEFCDKYGRYIHGIENEEGVIVVIVAISYDTGDIQIYTNTQDFMIQYNSLVTALFNEMVYRYILESGQQTINITIDASNIQQLQLFDQLQSPYVTNQVTVELLDYWIMEKCEFSAGQVSLSHLYIIAGQSNAAGRGDIDDLNPDNLHEHLDFYLASGKDGQANVDALVDSLATDSPLMEKLKYHDPVSGWSDLVPDMHKNVDIRKHVGVGVGYSFAVQMLHELNRQDASGDNRVGMIPVAIGATSIDEWMPEYVAPTLSDTSLLSSTFTSHYVPVMSPAQNCYYDGCLNILSCAMRSVYQALHRVCKTQQRRVHGIVWYQGENDAGDTAASTPYNEKLQLFFAVLRHYIQIIEELVSSPRSSDSVVPIINVLITTTRPWLKEVHTIRQHQLATATAVEKVYCIDTLGLALGVDNIHLTTASAVYLGITAASLLSISYYGESKLNAGSILTAAHQTYTQARDNVLQYFANDSVIQPPSVARKGALPILKTGLKAINFVYGEVDFLSFCKVLLLVHVPPNGVFVDLGCGSGTCIAAAILAPFYYSKYCPSTKLNPFSRFIGIDLMKSKIDDCTRLLLEMEAIVGRAAWPEVSVIYDNFLNVDWTHADVVYTCATCFAQDQLDLLFQRFSDLKVGCYVIIMDNMALADSPLFSVVGSAQCVASWGHSNAYVYRRVSTSAIE